MIARKSSFLSVHLSVLGGKICRAGGQLPLADVDDLQQVAADGSTLLFPRRDCELRQIGQGVGQLRPGPRSWPWRRRSLRDVQRLLRDHVVLVLVQRLEQ